MNRYTPKMQEIGAEQLGIHNGYVFLPISEGKLAEVELELGAVLPADYREFVRDYGFYSVATALFSFQRSGKSCTSDISSFRGIFQHNSYRDSDIVSYREAMIRAFEEFEEWSPHWIAIANAGSAHIAYAFTGPGCGKVFYFTPDGDYHRVADSFDEFMQRLQLES